MEENSERTLSRILEPLLQFLLLFLRTSGLAGEGISIIFSGGRWLILLVFTLCILILCGFVFTMFAVAGNSPYYQINCVTSDNSLLPLNTEFGNSSNSPQLTPLGGSDKYIVTAGFNDPFYFAAYKRWHKGVDIIPSESYYRQDPGYTICQKVILYATCNGNARSLKDAAGANYIYISCSDEVHGVYIVHNEFNFIPLGSSRSVFAGEPVAVMGDTGESNGAHVHYAVTMIHSGEYIDPLGGIK